MMMHYNNNSNYDEAYGKLLQLHCSVNGKLCPEGWHVPSISIILIDNNLYLKDPDRTLVLLFRYYRSGSTNEYGFTALPGGKRDDIGGDCRYGKLGLLSGALLPIYVLVLLFVVC